MSTGIVWSLVNLSAVGGGRAAVYVRDVTVFPAALVGATGGGGYSTLEDQRRALEESGGPKIYEAVHDDDASGTGQRD